MPNPPHPGDSAPPPHPRRAPAAETAASRSRWGLLRAGVAALLGAGLGAGAFVLQGAMPPEGTVATGLRVGGVQAAAGERARSLVEARARDLLARRIELRAFGESLGDVSLAELGGSVEVDAVTTSVASVGHAGDLFERLDAALEARAGRVDVPVRVRVPAEALAARLERVKEERDIAPRASRLDVATRTASEHRAGEYLDVYAAAEAIERSVASGARIVELPRLEVHPSASKDAVLAIDTRQVISKFETRFGSGGAQAGRAQNILRAAAQVEGVVLMPGETVSFNEQVGPRSIENGFAYAPEIYKGEMREGVGGGTCQVSGTLHAAAFFGGMEVIERANHSRPSGYIRIGLDATVVYPVVDLKLKNPFDFPIVIHSVIEDGTLRFELLGRVRPATVELRSDTVGVASFKRKVEEAAWLTAGTVKLKQKGIRGYSIKKTRVIRLAGGGEKVEVTTDVYPPTFEIYLVSPGTDVESALPPLEGGRPAETAAAEG